MANALYARGKEALLAGDFDWDAATVKLVLADSADYTPNLATDTGLTNVSVAGRVATSGTFTGRTPTGGVADAAAVTLTAVTGDPSELIIIYKDSGTETTSYLLVKIDVATGLPVTPNGGNITVNWDTGPSRIFSL